MYKKRELAYMYIYLSAVSIYLFGGHNRSLDFYLRGDTSSEVIVGYVDNIRGQVCGEGVPGLVTIVTNTLL